MLLARSGIGFETLGVPQPESVSYPDVALKLGVVDADLYPSCVMSWRFLLCAELSARFWKAALLKHCGPWP